MVELEFFHRLKLIGEAADYITYLQIPKHLAHFVFAKNIIFIPPKNQNPIFLKSKV